MQSPRAGAAAGLALLLVTGCPAEKSTSAPPTGPASETAAPAAGEIAPARNDGFSIVAPAPKAPEPGSIEAPLSLTASDGTGLELVSMAASGVVEGPLAFTELKLRFRNPEPRVREGRFRITLPENASISRFAMKIGSRWQEGEVVERQKARRTYEDFLHRRQDPALLEQAAGNEFTARVFPIPAGADKELIVSFSHELASSRAPYRIPLAGLPELAELKIRVLVGKAEAGAAATSLGGVKERHETVVVEKSKWVPDRDFEVEVPKSARIALRHENLAVARIQPELSAEPDGVHGLTVLVDTSASRALGFDKQARLLDQLVAGLARGSGPDTPLRIVAFDQGAVELYAGAAEGYDRDAKASLRRRRALGASDLTGALRWLAEHPSKARHDRLVILSDGVATTGDVDGAKAAAEALAATGLARIDAVAVGGLRDTARLASITTSGARAGVVLDGGLPIEEIGARLSKSTASGLAVSVPGATWVWPSTIDGVQPGDEVLVFADLPAGRPFEIQVGGQKIALGDEQIAAAPRPLLERAWVRARIARLLSQREDADPDLARAIERQVVELSTKHRVLSPFTALLVLETEHDYRRYGIDRAALADILTVGDRGISVLAERESPVVEPTPRPRPKRRPRPAFEADGDADTPGRAAQSAPRADLEEAPAKSLGTSGTGRGGGGVARPDPSFADDRAEGSVAREVTEREAAPPPMAEPEPAPSDAPEEARPARRTSRRRPPPASPPPPPAQQGLAFDAPEAPEAKDKAERPPAVTGPLAEVLGLLDAGKVQDALSKARAWREEAPGDVLALIALGEALEKQGDTREAARAYGSIIDLFPTRADLLRFAAYRLERIGSKDASRLAADTYAKAVKQRPDHPSGHRGLAFARLKLGDHAGAFEALEAGLAQRYPSRFPGVQRILQEDLGLVAAAWRAAAPKQAEQLEARLAKAGGALPDGPSLRFVLSWETDANDVDFHIHDAQGGHAYYSSSSLPSGGTLYADVTTGYGPECFTIPGVPRAFPYRLEAHYYRKGPMGYGMGRLQVLAHDGQGHLRFDERPFVVMTDGAYLDLGRVDAKWMQ